MRHPGRSVLLVALLLIAALPSFAGEEFTGPMETSPWTWEGVPRIVALGDTHGGFAQVQLVLFGLELVDEDLRWAGGNTHLVFVGDMTDRGPQERQLLDLVRRLQGEAEEADGRVHVLLGNHEVMNMMQDLRYVPPEGYESFIDEEDPDQRREASKRFYGQIRAEGLNRENFQRRFEDTYPPGYFARRSAFGPDGVYSNWLLDQHVILRLNGFVFVHGGLTEETAGLGYERINQSVKNGIRNYWKLREVLIESGKMTVSDDFRRTMGIAAEVLSGMANKVEKEAAGALREILKSPAVSPEGPVWYRGNSLEPERVERERVAACLETLGGRAMVVGHSIAKEGHITSRFGGKLFRADVGMAYPGGGAPQALVIEDTEVRVFDARTGELAVATIEPPEGEGALSTVPQLSDLVLENLLESGKVQSVRQLGKGSTRPMLMEFRKDKKRVRGVCKNVQKPGDRYQHEIAAYRLDRRLGLNLVPVTVLRKSGVNVPCSLQYFVEHALDAQGAREYGLPPGHDEAIKLQLEDGRVFDALIGNLDRKESDILHIPVEGKIALIDHSRAFTLETDLKAWFPEGRWVLAPEMEAALKNLESGNLKKVLRGWLDKDQIKAVEVRRDALLEGCSQTGS